MSDNLLKAKIDTIQEDLADIVKRLQEIEENWNNLPKHERTRLGLDPEEIDKLSWTTFKGRSKGEWIFSSEDPRLKDVLLKNHGKMDFEDYHYKLSGEDNRFINRFPMSDPE